MGSSPIPATTGPLVKRLRHRPFTAVTAVRFCYGSPTGKRGLLFGNPLFSVVGAFGESNCANFCLQKFCHSVRIAEHHTLSALSRTLQFRFCYGSPTAKGGESNAKMHLVLTPVVFVLTAKRPHFCLCRGKKPTKSLARKSLPSPFPRGGFVNDSAPFFYFIVPPKWIACTPFFV